MKIFAAAALAVGLMTAGVANATVVYFEGFDGYDTGNPATDPNAIQHGAQASGVSSVLRASGSPVITVSVAVGSMRVTPWKVIRAVCRLAP